MTTPGPPPVDQGNQLLAEGPSQITTALIPTPAGQRMVLTVRTASATVTVLLGKQDAETWAANIAGAAAKMSVSGLVVANGHGALPLPGGGVPG